MEQQQAKFEGWALVEMMGHQREIGFVTTEYFGPAALFRVDAPEIPERETELKRPEYLSDPATGRTTLCPKGTKVRRGAIPAKTRLVAPGAIYALNPCTEEMAKAAIEDAVPRPILALELPKESAPQALPPVDQTGRDLCEACAGGDHDDCDGQCECAVCDNPPEGWNGDGR